MRRLAVAIALTACGRVGFDQVTRVDGGVDTSANVMFVTSISHDGALGGLAGADALCTQLAAAARLPGTYRAWLSTSTTDAKSRFPGASGWVRPDGKPVADTIDDLVAGTLFYPPEIDETGTNAGQRLVVTGTTQAGVSSGTTCGDWTLADNSTVTPGLSDHASAAFTQAFGIVLPCNGNGPIYCLGIDHAGHATVAPPPSRHAFLSAASVALTNGLASADMLCASEASAAGLAGTYRALLATTSASAASRFDTSGLPWARVDGALLTSVPSQLFNAGAWQTALDVAPSGDHIAARVWTGGSLTVPGSATGTCNDWTGGSGATGCAGASDSASPGATYDNNLCGVVPMSCSTPAHVYCLQQ